MLNCLLSSHAVNTMVPSPSYTFPKQCSISPTNLFSTLLSTYTPSRLVTPSSCSGPWWSILMASYKVLNCASNGSMWS